MDANDIVLVIGAVAAALSTLIPLYFRERAKARLMETQRDIMIEEVENVGPGPVSKRIKERIKRTSMDRGVDEDLARAVEEHTKGKQ